MRRRSICLRRIAVFVLIDCISSIILSTLLLLIVIILIQIQSLLQQPPPFSGLFVGFYPGGCFTLG